MRNLKILLKIFLNIGTARSSKGDSKEKRRTDHMVTVFFVLFVIPLMVSVGFLSFYLTDMLKFSGLQFLVLQLGTILASLFMLFFGMVMIPSVFYHSDDIASLASLPVKPFDIINAKFIVTYLWENLTAVFVFLPVVIGYAIAMEHIDITYILGSVIIGALVSLAPVLIGTIATMLIIAYTPFGSDKSITSYITSTLSIVVSVAMAVFMISAIFSNTDPFLALIASSSKIIKPFAMIFPCVRYIHTIMLNMNVTAMIKLIAFNAVYVIVYLIVAKTCYFKGLRKLSASCGSFKMTRSKSGLAAIDTSYSHSKLYHLIRRDIIDTFIDPTVFTSCITTVLILPLVLFFTQLTDLRWTMIVFKKTTSPIVVDSYYVAGCIICGAVIFGMSYMASTCISREGKDHMAIKFLPISYKQYIIAKLISSTIIMEPFYLFSVFMLRLYAGSSIWSILWGVLLGNIFGILLEMIEIIIELYNPNLLWMDKQKAIKQNVNGEIGFVLSIIMAALLCVIVLNSYSDVFRVSAILVIILGALTRLAWLWLMPRLDRLFAKS